MYKPEQVFGKVVPLSIATSADNKSRFYIAPMIVYVKNKTCGAFNLINFSINEMDSLENFVYNHIRDVQDTPQAVIGSDGKYIELSEVEKMFALYYTAEISDIYIPHIGSYAIRYIVVKFDLTKDKDFNRCINQFIFRCLGIHIIATIQLLGVMRDIVGGYIKENTNTTEKIILPSKRKIFNSIYNESNIKRAIENQLVFDSNNTDIVHIKDIINIDFTEYINNAMNWEIYKYNLETSEEIIRLNKFQDLFPSFEIEDLFDNFYNKETRKFNSEEFMKNIIREEDPH